MLYKEPSVQTDQNGFDAFVLKRKKTEPVEILLEKYLVLSR